MDHEIKTDVLEAIFGTKIMDTEFLKEQIKKNSNDFLSELELYRILNEDEIEIINKAYSLFDEYLKSDEFVLVHNDLHFDNIFYKDGKIKLIDFERSMYAPKDFELHIIYYMTR